MSLGKIGTTLGKEIVAWTRATSKSMLATRPVKVKVQGLKLAQKLEVDVVQITKKETIRPSYCYANKVSGGACFANVPKDYTTNERLVHIEETPEYWRKGFKKCNKDTPGAIYHPAKPAYDITERDWAPAYHIDKLSGNGKGDGTRAVQHIVLKSLKDPVTAGRVRLDACCIDGKTHPAGFYYKLGFRHTSEAENIRLEKWLNEGGKRENAPYCQGIMYLPKENIEQCLKYGNSTYSCEDKLLIKNFFSK